MSIGPVQGLWPRSPVKSASLLSLPLNVVRDFGASASVTSTTGSMVAGSNELIVASVEDFQNRQGISVAGAAQIANPTIAVLSQAAGTSSFVSGDTVHVVYAFQDAAGNSTLVSPDATIAISTSGNTVSFSATMPITASAIAVYSGTAAAPLLLGTISVAIAASLATITYSGGLAAGLSVSIVGDVYTVTVSASASGTGDAEPVANTTAVLLSAFVSEAAGTTFYLTDANGNDLNADNTVNNVGVYHDDTAAFQNACDAAGLNAGTVIIPAGGYNIQRILLQAKTHTVGQGMWSTVLFRVPGSVCTPTIREKTSAEGNPSGAGGIWLTDMFIDGRSGPGDGVYIGGQVPGNQLNFNASIQHIYVQKFSSGIGIDIIANAVACYYLWSNTNRVGIEVSSGSSAWYGLWAEGNSEQQIVVAGVGQMIYGIQCESNGTGYPFITIEGDNHVLVGLALAMSQDCAKAIELVSGGQGLHSTILHVSVATNGHVLTDTIFDDAWGVGSGSIDILPFWFPMDGGMAGFFYDKTTGSLSTLTGTEWAVRATSSFSPNTTTLNGTTAGSIQWVQDEQGMVKRFVGYLNGYENTTAVAQTVVFPQVFSHTPVILSQPSAFGATVSTTTLTLPISMAATATGVIIIEGM